VLSHYQVKKWPFRDKVREPLKKIKTTRALLLFMPLCFYVAKKAKNIVDTSFKIIKILQADEGIPVV
jgi:hypothetical protein